MTMVLDAQARQYGGMGYDNNMYSTNMHAPNFTDPWAHQTSNHGQYQPMSKPETRPSLSLSYQQMPPTSAPLASGSDYSTLGLNGTSSLSYHQDIPRSTGSFAEPAYTSPSAASSSYSTSYPHSLSYAQQLHHQQQAQQQRKMSET